MFIKGLQAYANGHEYLALVCFENAAELERDPLYCSYLAFCLKVRGNYNKAIALCEEPWRRNRPMPFIMLILDESTC